MGKDKGLTLADRLKSIDFYKSLPKDLAEPTVSGATGTFIIDRSNRLIVSLFVLGLMGALFVSEVMTFMQY